MNTTRGSLTGLAAVLVAVAAIPASTGSRPVAPAPAPRIDVVWMPERPVQGRLFTLRVLPAAGERPVGVEGTVAEEPLHFEDVGGGVFQSLAAVPVGSEGSVGAIVTVRLADGRAEFLEREVPVGIGSYRHERLTVPPELGRPLAPEAQVRLDRDREKAAEVSRRAHRTPRMWSDAVVLPRTSRVTSGFGNGRIFNGQVSSRHMGLDLAGRPGDTVVAVSRGVVALVDDFLLAGRIVYLNHGAGVVSGYFHLSEPLVQEGDTVEAGTPVGLVGATGRVTGPHLHWVVRYGSISVDPRSFPGLPPMDR